MTSLGLALASVILSPVLVLIELTALLFAAMVIGEPANSRVAKVLAVAVVVVVGLLAFALPVIAIVIGARVRAASRSMPTRGSGLAAVAVVIAGIVTVVVALSQVYLAYVASGVCSLEWC